MKVGDLVKHQVYGLGIVVRQNDVHQCQARWYCSWASFPEIYHAISEWKLEVINESR